MLALLMSLSMAVNPDPELITRAVSALYAPTDILELRAIYTKGRKRVDAGYFDGEHRGELVRNACQLNKRGASVYVTLNSLDPQLLARCANRVQEYAQATATDANVTQRRWLLIDIDPQRPKDTSATAEQLGWAVERAGRVRNFLTERGWPAPATAESGNGLHLLYRIDLPNDDASRDLIKACLEALSKRFSDEHVKIDQSVFNAARIVKLHGTVANKGDDVPIAPWRLSRLSEVPESPVCVDRELLQALAREVPRDEPAARETQLRGVRPWGEAQVANFLQRAHLEATGPDQHNGALRWKLHHCPFNPDHGFGEAAVFLRDGRLGFECRHDSCQDKEWRHLRELVDGKVEDRKRTTPRTNGSHSPPAEEVPPNLSEEELERWAIQHEEVAGTPTDSTSSKTRSDASQDSKGAPEPPIEATPYVWVMPQSIPPRPWLFGQHYMRGMVSATAGIGGAGKTSLLLVEALCLVTGRDLFSRGEPIAVGPQPVWMHNEDPMDEMSRRIASACIHYRLGPEDLGGRLHVTSSRSTQIMIARELSSGGKILVPTNHGQQIIDQITTRKICLFMVDPFVAVHRVSENDNVMVEAVMQILRGIAEETKASVELAHHFRKLNGQEPSADDIRGASSIVGACRSVRVVAQMTTEEAEGMDIQPEERKSYIWLQNAKANMSPPLLARRWFQLQSIDLDNAVPPYAADSVGVVTEWTPPAKAFDLTAPEFRAVRLAFKEAANPLLCLRYDARSAGWAGKLIGKAIDMDPEDSGARVKLKALIERWIHSKRLRIVKVDDHKQARKVPVLQWVETEEA